MTIRKLSTDEKLSTSTSIKDTTCTATFGVRASEASTTRFALTCKLDFSGCSREELIALASKSVIIDVQRQWRVAHIDDKTDPKSNEFATVDVKKSIVDATRKTADPMAKVKSALSGMSPEAVAALLAEYTKANKAA